MKDNARAEPETLTSPAGRVVFIRAPKRLSEDELRLALAGLEENAPVWLAVNQFIDEELAAAVLDSSSPTLDASKGTYAGGKIAAMGELKERLHRYRVALVRAPETTKKKR